jgi:hypothetical protein
MLVVGADGGGLLAARTGPVFSFEAPFLHALERNHLVNEMSSLGQKLGVHSEMVPIG